MVQIEGQFGFGQSTRCYGSWCIFVGISSTGFEVERWNYGYDFDKKTIVEVYLCGF